MPVAVAQKVLIAAEQKKVIEEKVSLLQSDINILSQRIAEKEAIVNELKAKDENNKLIIQNYQDEIRLMKEQRDTFEKWVKDLEKQLRKQKRKTFWTAMAGAAATAGGIVATIMILK